jgi:hypothetical protein
MLRDFGTPMADMIAGKRYYNKSHNLRRIATIIM